MTNIIAILLSALLLCLPARAAELPGKVIGVTDGDTVKILIAGHKQERIRLAGIDAPERRQPYGQKSRQHLSNMIFGRQVVVVWKKRDRYKRIIGKIVLDEKTDVGLEQIKAGLAWHYKAYQKDQSGDDRQTYADAELRARDKRAGLWSDANPVAPWAWRRNGK
ncbi:MAG: nuclease [Oxalobacter sp.]|nr:MAG: nuclease [Oxalobacter sp.]